MGCHQYTTSSNSTTLESNKSVGSKVSSRSSPKQASNKPQTSPRQVKTSPKTPTPSPITPSTQVAVEQEAEECFLKAIEIAQHQQAKSLELRAVMSLSSAVAAAGQKAEAHKLLAEIYNWFTEGFDTKDLQEAKALLEELT